MSDYREYVDYIMEQAKNLLATDSPSGYGREITEYLLKELEALGIPVRRTVKGGVIVDFGGRSEKGGTLLEARCDTLGSMVAQVKENDRLELTDIGGMKPANAKAENVRIIAKADEIYERTCQLVDVSVHANDSYERIERAWGTMEALADEDVKCREDVMKLGIMPGDYVCLEPRTRITSSGYIKSRSLDDKLSAAILLGYVKYTKDESVNPERRAHAHFTIYEEVGHGGAVSVPKGMTEAWSVDMGRVEEDLQYTEREVSVCVKGSGGPYNCGVVCRLVELAKEHGIGYTADIYPHYDSDVETTLKAGHDVCHALIGPGVYTPYGCKRSRGDGVGNTFKLIQAYIG